MTLRCWQRKAAAAAGRCAAEVRLRRRQLQGRLLPRHGSHTGRAPGTQARSRKGTGNIGQQSIIVQTLTNKVQYINLTILVHEAAQGMVLQKKMRELMANVIKGCAFKDEVPFVTQVAGAV
jgi:hypothetical protein